MRRRSLALLAAVGAAAALAVAAALAAPGGGGAGRLVIHDAAGLIATMRPDGSGRAELTGPAEPPGVNAQPTWSPDGRLVAWAEVGADSAAIHVAAADGGEQRSAVVPIAPFYLAWSPDGGRVAALGNVSGGIGAVVATVSDTGMEVAGLGQGSPYYFDWAPDGGRILAHVGTGALAEVDAATGEQAPVDGVEPGSFRAPSWPGGDLRVYAERGTVRQALVVDGDGGRERVVDFAGSIAFDVAAGRIAYQAAGGGSDTAVAAAVGAPVPAPPEVLAVLELAAGTQTVVSREPALAFEWSPDGRYLLYLLPAEGEPSDRVRWHVWDGASSTSFEAHRPSAVYLRDYLPFFDQYARSQTAWAPDSSGFAYAGTGADGLSGVWVQWLDDPAPVYVSAGDMVSWSPGP